MNKIDIFNGVINNSLPRGVIRFVNWIMKWYYIKFLLFKGESTSLKFSFGSKSVFTELFRGQSGVYGEYGSGASTIWIKKNTPLKIITIENSRHWYNIMSQSNLLSTERMVLVDLGPVSRREYSRVLTYDKLESFRNYTLSLFKFDDKPDIILIDGRFNLACFFEILYMTDKPVTIFFNGYPDFRATRSMVERYILPDYVDRFCAVFYVKDYMQFHTEEINKLIESSLFSLTNN